MKARSAAEIVTAGHSIRKNRQVAGMVGEGTVVWTPDREALEESQVARFLTWLREQRGTELKGYAELWRWSIDKPEAFWAAVWDYFGVAAATPYTRVLAEASMPGARWFEGATLNLASHFLRGSPERTALVFGDESGNLGELTFAGLRAEIAAVQRGLERLGVGRGDRVVAYMPNVRETAVACLAVAGLGAIWSSVSPEFGTGAVIDRFGQLEPKVLLAVDSYVFGGKRFDRSGEIDSIRRSLPGLEHAVLGTAAWQDAFPAVDAEPRFEEVPFDHPLWVVYTSGTTGMPKGIVHGHGGILLESLVQSALQLDLSSDDRFFWFSTTSWVMWNIVLGALSVEAAAVLYDGSPTHPDVSAPWQFVERSQATFFGTSAAYVQACMKVGLRPRERADLSRVRAVGLTGSPLAPEGFGWIEAEVKPGVFIANISGGTDVCGALASSSKLLPVRAGELQAPALGVRLEAWNEEGRPVVGEVGELVVTAPMPSMPVFFWNDESGNRYHESYFDVYPGVWRHGDWIKLTPEGSCVLYGRSDATLNRGGVRMGTAEFYRVVEELPWILDSLIIDLGNEGREGRLLLFVVTADGKLGEDRDRELRSLLRRQLSPRHEPDEIHLVASVPRTLTGKKLEVPVKRILLGQPIGAAANADVIADAKSLDYFAVLAAHS